MHVFTKDLQKLTAGLEAACDEATVIQQYKYALVVKDRVRCEFLSDFGSVVLMPLKVCANSRNAAENGENVPKTKR